MLPSGEIIAVFATMPFVTDCDTPAGLPIASTTSPTASLSEFPNLAGRNFSLGFLRLDKSSFKMARSLNASVPISVASTSSRFESRQTSRVARPATWWFVMM